MNGFDYQRADSQAQALALIKGSVGTRILAGGTTQLDLMKCGVETPSTIIDITRLPDMSYIRLSDERIEIGALAKMGQVAASHSIQGAAPAVYESLWQAASAQLRNMASIGGNIMQRTRCSYFRDPQAYTACNKRTPGSGCAALEGINRNHAVLGGSESCIATFPGDLSVALTAFDAVIHVQGNDSSRSIPIADFYRLPEQTPHLENNLTPDEMIVAVEIPRSPALMRSHYLKVRDRASYEFAAASAAVGLELASDGETINAVRIALGGVATKPWRVRQVEQALVGQRFTEANVREAAMLGTEGARSMGQNRYKIDLIPKVISRAVLQAGGLA